MIDIESEIFNEVATKVRAKYPNVYITGEYVKAPPKFPCISLVEVINETWRNTRDTSGDAHNAITYELNVYSNKTKGRKSECKELANYVDEILIGMNFLRRTMQPVPNQYDATIYRMVGRYRALVGKDKTMYRR